MFFFAVPVPRGLIGRIKRLPPDNPLLRLDDMCELMRQQPAARFRLRRILILAEDDIRADRIGKRIHSLGRLRGLSVCTNSNATEIVAETALHGGARGGVE